MNDFSKALLRSAKELDVPEAGAKARAMAHVGTAAATVATATAVTAVTSTGIASSKLAMVVASIAAASAIAAGGYAVGRSSIRVEPPAVTQRASSTSVSDSPSVRAVVTPRASESAPPPPVDVCTTVPALADAPPTVCSAPNGKRLSFELKNGCGATVDVFWIDFKCQEIFRGRLEPGETFRQNAADTHPWRIRDHVTHRLVKEFTATLVPGALTEDAGTTKLPDVVARDEAPLSDTAPVECTRDGAPATFTLKNERADGLMLMRVDHDCREIFTRDIRPGSSQVIHTSTGAAWRLRDKNGGLVSDMTPSTPDTTTYLTVP